MVRVIEDSIAQYILDYFGFEKIANSLLAEILEINHVKSAYILRNLGWQEEKVKTTSKNGNPSRRLIFHRNGVHKDMKGLPATLARKRVAKMLCTTPAQLQEACMA